jgi:hypothetical protein
VSDYELDDRAIEVRSPAEAKRIFPLASVFRSAVGSNSLLYNGYRGPFFEGKARQGRDAGVKEACMEKREMQAIF